MGVLALALLIPISIFIFTRKGIKKTGVAEIHESFTKLTLADKIITMRYADVKQYRIEVYAGGYIALWFNDGTKLKLEANHNFCNPESFSRFSYALEHAIESHPDEDSNHPVKLPSVFQKPWMLPFIMLLSVILIAGLGVALYMRKSIPPSFYLAFVPIASLWTGYFISRTRRD